MANESLINMTGLGDAITERLLTALSPLITIFKIVGVAVLVYVLFLIIRAFLRWRTSSRVGKISKNVKQINQKMDILIRHLKPSKAVKEKVEEKKKKGKK
jgi:hypothetical protein